MKSVVRSWNWIYSVNIFLVLTNLVIGFSLARDFTKGQAASALLSVLVSTYRGGEKKSDLTPSHTPTLTSTPTFTPALNGSTTPTPFQPVAPTAVFTPTATATATPLPLPPEEWRKYPLLPSEISEAAKEIYLRGIAMGNNPHAFSIIGDCQSEPKVFLGTYDTDRFQLPTEFQYLEETIANFTGSFSRMGAAVID
ncbi:MAG TPA: hypothetical protein ENI27_02075, partial [bacterium]|nr:hypothetical protein [bacterium]